MSPLHHAVKHGQTGCAELLITRGAGVDVGDDIGRNPLHYATANLDCIDLLLEKVCE